MGWLEVCVCFHFHRFLLWFGYTSFVSFKGKYSQNMIFRNVSCQKELRKGMFRWILCQLENNRQLRLHRELANHIQMFHQDSKQGYRDLMMNKTSHQGVPKQSIIRDLEYGLNNHHTWDPRLSIIWTNGLEIQTIRTKTSIIFKKTYPGEEWAQAET